MRFSKMHGLGNDFVIIDSITQHVCLTMDKIRQLSNRNCGIGFDQLLIIEPPYDPEVDFHCRIYNSDGSEISQCGNGIRCAARFVYMKKLTNKNNIQISTNTNNMSVSVIHNDYVSVNMGEPIFDPQLIPFYSSEYQNTYILFIPDQAIVCSVVSMGNPHCVVLETDVTLTSVSIVGSMLEKHHRFPNKTNISFMQVIDKDHIKLRVYERGVGETQACGSGACAAVAVGIRQGLLLRNKSIKVNLVGGTLLISWKGVGNPLHMIGSATFVYDGCIHV